ncbi:MULTISPECIES: shikimate dehydrogenase [Oceanobacillus]|uniref:Shikimate dehydrogenase (NADP(+)) n=1 Tax=Oceanobacillus aidingensis TaxID=645964 RepID=A0ABV9JSB4_9BACI|nr:shikimate dehydrogenase [Oceanobacillus oncorhynchi]UUI39903.1 shikimate dehydrogenase [Oceanobacillus oncorhynchi]
MKKLFGVLGNPIAHSLSPLIQNRAYASVNIHAYFQPFHVEQKDLENAVKGMKALGIEGFMVTVPFKSEILSYLDELTPTALTTGAVNVVHLIDGKYVGFNLDGQAWLSAAKEDMGISELTNEHVLLIGAGGAARSIYYTLSQHNHVKIDIANRTLEKAENLKGLNENRIKTRTISLEEAEDNLEQYDIIVQTTSIGMWPHKHETPIQVKKLKENVFVSDIIYNPYETAFLKQARNKGAFTQNGIKMLASQNAYCIEKWTGSCVDSGKMVDILEESLR